MVIIISIILLGFSAALSGVMAALLPISLAELRRKAELGHLQARAVLPLREKGSQLFVSLLSADILVSAGLVGVMASAIQTWIAVVYASLLILVFGEVLPRAIFGRYGLKMGTQVAPVLHYLMLGLFPIAKPLSLLLDRTLRSQTPSFLSREELVKLIEQHSQSQDSNISPAELEVVARALTFNTKRIGDYMVARKAIVSVKVKDTLTLKLMEELHDSGHARVPVTAGDLDHIAGILSLHNLEVKPRAHTTVADVMEPRSCYLHEDATFEDAIKAFMQTKSHIFIVVDDDAKTAGLITVEDIVSQLLGAIDTSGFDRYDDAAAVAQKYQ